MEDDPNIAEGSWRESPEPVSISDVLRGGGSLLRGVLVTIIIVSSDPSFVSLGENASVDFPLFPVLKPLVFSDDCEELVAVIGCIVVPKKGTVGQDEDEFFLDSNPDMGGIISVKIFPTP